MKVSFFNNQTSFYPEVPSDPFSAPGGRIFAANDVLFDQLRGLANDANSDVANLSEPITQYIVGYRDPENLQELLDSLAPPVTVGRRFEYRTHTAKEDFMDDADDDSDIRKIGGDFKIVDAKGTKVDGATDNKGLVMVLDNDDGGENQSVQQNKAAVLRNRLLRTDIRRVFSLLDANDTNTNTNWGPGNANRDPDGDLLTLCDVSGDDRGIMPNVVTIGGGAGVKRKIALRSKASPDEVGARSTYQELADFLEVNRVIPVKARRQASAAAKAKILGDAVFAYYAAPDATENDPSNVKNFVTLTPSGRFRVYILPKFKRTLIAVEHYSRPVITSTIGIRKLSVTFTG